MSEKKENIIIDNQKFDYLQIYKVDLNFRSNKNEMQKVRPHILFQISEVGKFYGNTKFMCIPLTPSPNRQISMNKNFVVEISENSNALIYNYSTKTESEIKFGIIEIQVKQKRLAKKHILK